VQLATEAPDGEDPSVFGEEAHIVGKSPSGPRAGRLTDIDGYHNLILLCRKHHKQVDDQIRHFTVERLKQIKHEHEKWASSLGSDASFGPVKIVPDPARPAPKTLKLFVTGSRLWHFVDGSMGFYPSWPDGLSDEHEDMIAAFLDDLRDWNDIASDLDSYGAKRDAAKCLDGHIKRLAKAGFLVGARQRFCLLVGGIQETPMPWRLVDIEIQPAALALAQLADIAGQRLDVAQDAAQPTS
jgi:hypothetical protein